MQVYIEYAIIDNLVINFLLLKSSCKITKTKTNSLRLLLSSSVGTVVAIILPLFSLKNVYLLIVKVLMALLMPYLLSKFYTLKKYAYLVLVFLLLTFLSGGVIIAFTYFFEIALDWNYPLFPMGLTILIIYLLSKVCIYYVNLLLKYRDIHPFLKKCILVVDGVRFKVKGFIDSGNHLYDSKNGLPIIVANQELFEKITKSAKLKFYAKQEVESVGGNSQINLYLIDKLLIYNGDKVNILSSVLIGFSNVNFYGGDYSLLLHPSLI